MTPCMHTINSTESTQRRHSYTLGPQTLSASSGGGESVEMMTADEIDTAQLHQSQEAMTILEKWDDAFEFDANHSFERIFEQLQFPRSPLSDRSDQSDYFQSQAIAHPLTTNRTSGSRRPSYSSYTHALPTPPTTTTATTLMSSRGTPSIISLGYGSSQSTIKRLAGSAEVPGNRDKVPCAACAKKHPSSSSPTSSSSSLPRAVPASIAAPPIVATSTRSLLQKDKDGGDAPIPSAKSMTTITQEMMHSNLPAYTGIITRINPIKRVAAWVDDLEDLEVPEEDLDFNHVRSILAKSPPALETLESIDLWDTDSENSTSRSDDVPNTETLSRAMSSVTVSTMSIMQLSQLSQPSVNGSIRPENRGGVQRTDSRAGLRADTEAMETLDDDFDLPEDFNSLRLQLPGLNNQEPYQSGSIKNRCLLKSHVSLQQWRDSGSDIDDFEFGTPLDNNSLSSSASFSRDSMVDEENFLDGIIFPEAMEGLQLVINRTYRPELDPSIFGKESRFQEEQDDFWDGLGVDDDDAFNHKGRNKNLIVRAAPMGRDRSESRVQREVVPLKDFVALPSRIPRLCRTPGDNSKSITPAQSLSRMHSTQFELPLRDLRSKSSIPRMRRSSIPKKNGTRSSLIISSVDPSEGSSACSSTFTSRAPTPTALQFTGSKRSSLLSNTDDFPSFKASSLAMRSVSFTEPAETTRLDNLKSGELALSLANSPRAKPPTPQNQGKSFSGLRTLVRKLELVRPKFSTRSPIPVFESVATLESESRPLALPYPAKSNPPIEPENDLKGALKRPPNSRSSSCTDWGSLLASTEITKESRPSSRAGLVSLGDISEVLATDPGETVTPVAATDRFSRRVFLKRSPKHSTFGDGSELDRFDNLPTFGPRQKREEERLQASQVVVQVRRHSTERVAAWLRKPQSIANFKEFHKPEAKATECEQPSPSKIRKSKSLRKSLFDIFGQAATAPEPAELPEKKKRKRTSNGPTLIRNLSQSRVRKVSGMVYSPKDRMWNGNDDILDEFEDEDDGCAPSEFPTSPANLYTMNLSTVSANRPALISNMSQYSKQRTQVAGKMIFDPARMCWIVNPEYIVLRRQRRDDHRRQRSLDETWGDEPDIFAGLSDSDNDKSQEERVDEEIDLDGEGAMGSSSVGKRRGSRLLSRPSFQRNSSQEYLAEQARLQAWAETMKPSSSNEPSDSRPISMGLHSVVSKSSRKSLNAAHHGGCSSGFSGGGYSSRGEFEVGVEFDTTDAFLEQCIAAEAQHRKDAGKFFALPCTQTVLDTQTAASSYLSKMTPSKALALGRKAGNSKSRGSEKKKMKMDDGEEKEGDSRKGREKTVEPAEKEKVVQEKKLKNSSPLLSWPLRGKSRSKSLAAHLTRNEGISSQSCLVDTSSMSETPSLGGLEDQSGRDNRNKRRSFGKPGLFHFVSSYSSTPSAAPAAATLAARGRGGSSDAYFHRLPGKCDSSRGSLSFAVTLAIARRGATSYDRRRIGNHTFDPPNNIKGLHDDTWDGSWKGDKHADVFKDEDEEEFVERGYRLMSAGRARPPTHSRMELLSEFESHTRRQYQ